MRQEVDILKNAIYAEALKLKRRVAIETGTNVNNEPLSDAIPYLNSNGSFRISYLAEGLTKIVNWVNAIDSDARFIVDKDGNQVSFDNFYIPEILKQMIWPKTVKLDPTNYYMHDLIVRHKYDNEDDIDVLTFDEVQLLIVGINALLYNDPNHATHVIKVSDVRVDVSLMNVLSKATVATEVVSDSNDIGKWVCNSSLNGEFKVPLDSLGAFMTLQGYFDSTLEDNVKVLKSKFSLEY